MAKGRLVTVDDIHAHPELSKRGISVNQYHDFDNDPLLQDDEFEQEDDEVIYQPTKKAEAKKVETPKVEIHKKEVAEEAPKKAAAPKKSVVTKSAPKKAEAKAVPKKGGKK